MRRAMLRNVTIIVPCCLIAALALGQVGCSTNDESSAQQPSRGERSARPGGSRAPAKSPGGQRSSKDDKLKDPLLRSFEGALGEADDLEDSDRSQAQKILREADPILTRIKEENRKGLERVNRPPRRKLPPRQVETAPKPAEKTAGKAEE